MFSFLRRKKEKPEIDLEKLLYNVAEFRRDEDFQLLYSVLAHREVFLPVLSETLPPHLEAGSRYVTGASDAIRIRTAPAPDGRQLLAVATRKDHPMLRNACIGMQWPDFLRLSLKTENNYGVLIQGVTSWSIFDNDRVQHILAQYET